MFAQYKEGSVTLPSFSLSPLASIIPAGIRSPMERETALVSAHLVTLWGLLLERAVTRARDSMLPQGLASELVERKERGMGIKYRLG